MNSQPDKHPGQKIVLYFQVHQPWRLHRFRFFDIGQQARYFDEVANRTIVTRIAEESYLPTNRLLLDLINAYPNIRITFSISGTALDQFEQYAPAVLDSFAALARTGAVEFLAETYHHSLSALLPGHEFEEEVLQHAARLQELFGVRASVFRNTELIYNDAIGKRAYDLGFNGVFTDGIERVLGDQSPHHLYHHPNEPGLKIFLRNYHLSDDIAFRFQQGGKTLTAAIFLSWIQGIPAAQNVVNIALDYETFGEHHKRDSSIHRFLEKVLVALARSRQFKMATPSEVINTMQAVRPLSIPQVISWADRERDLSAWLGNDMQQDAFNTLVKLESKVKALGGDTLSCWRKLTTSDHFYYMSTKTEDDGNVHAYFSPYPSPYEAFMNYMNVLNDFSQQIEEKDKHIPTVEEASLKAEAGRRVIHEHEPIWAMNLEHSYEH